MAFSLRFCITQNINPSGAGCISNCTDSVLGKFTVWVEGRASEVGSINTSVGKHRLTVVTSQLVSLQVPNYVHSEGLPKDSQSSLFPDTSWLVSIHLRVVRTIWLRMAESARWISCNSLGEIYHGFSSCRKALGRFTSQVLLLLLNKSGGLGPTDHHLQNQLHTYKW